MGWARSFLVAALLASAGSSLGLANPAQAEHPAERVVLVVIDGPRHDLAFDEDGPLAPLHDAANVTFANDTWTAGPALTVPGHAALLSGRAQPIANDGSQRPRGPLLWDRLAEERSWGAAEMRWLYEKPKLGVLATAPTGGGHLAGQPSTDAMLDALEANLSDEHARLVVASFAEPDVTAHREGWPAHRASLAQIGEGLAPIVEAQAGPHTLVIVTADHARYCDEPEDHGRRGPFAPLDRCDAQIPLWAAGWHVVRGGTVEACLTQADVGVGIAGAMGTNLTGATGRFPAPLVNRSAAWDPLGCPTKRSGLPVPVPGPGAAEVSLVVLVAASLTSRLRRAA